MRPKRAPALMFLLLSATAPENNMGRERCARWQEPLANCPRPLINRSVPRRVCCRGPALSPLPTRCRHWHTHTNLCEYLFLPPKSEGGSSHHTSIKAQLQSKEFQEICYVLWKLCVLWPCLLTGKHWIYLTGNHTCNTLLRLDPAW